MGRVPPTPRRPGRLLGLYALSVMARDGPVHGYGLAQRIRERTEGSWRPGPGAIYPALRRLTERGFARSGSNGPRVTFEITPQGRRFLNQLVQRSSGGAKVPDTTSLWMEIVGEGDRGRYLLGHLRRHLDQARDYSSKLGASPEGAAFRRDLRRELAGGRIRPTAPPGKRPKRRPRRV